MRLGLEALLQYRGDARFAEAGFAGDQHDLPIPCLRARPTAQQQVDLLIATDQRGQRQSAQRLETTGDDTWAQHLPGRHRAANALHLDGLKFEQLADQPPRAFGDQHGIGSGELLQAGGKARRLAHYAALP